MLSCPAKWSVRSLRGAAWSYSRSSSESANSAMGSSRFDFFNRYALKKHEEGEGMEEGKGDVSKKH